ncbi:MAG: OmpH family outer membrane protein [Bacteroidetes bacterium]|nr:OmpH family outer membrane protein [Bacteroidota bacterium]
MKNASIILNAVLLVAVAFLYYKVYNTTSEPVVKPPVSKEGMKIAFVRTDTLFENYKLYKEMEDAFEKERESAEQMVASQENSLKKKIEQYQQQGAMMTDEQRAQREEQLGREQQSFMQLREEIMSKLSDREKLISDSLHNLITNNVREMNKKSGYDYILGYQRGSGIIYADSIHDITTNVLQQLNK